MSIPQLPRPMTSVFAISIVGASIALSAITNSIWGGVFCLCLLVFVACLVRERNT